MNSQLLHCTGKSVNTAHVQMTVWSVVADSASQLGQVLLCLVFHPSPHIEVGIELQAPSIEVGTGLAQSRSHSAKSPWIPSCKTCRLHREHRT